MPGILDLVGAALGGSTTQSISQQVGANPQSTQTAIQAALPMILAGLTRNVQQPGGADALNAALQRDHDGGLLENLGGLLGGAIGGKAADGAGILDHVLGARQGSASQAVAQTSGLSAQQAAQIMAIVAPIVMAAIARSHRQQGGGAGSLAGMLQGAQSAHAQAQPDLMGLANRLLDRDGDGSALNDIMGGLGKMFGGR